jgi:hypothetical protein
LQLADGFQGVLGIALAAAGEPKAGDHSRCQRAEHETSQESRIESAFHPARIDDATDPEPERLR